MTPDVTLPPAATDPAVTDMALPPVAHDLSMLGLFLQADMIVKGVMVLLLLASVVCWAIIIDKAVKFARLRRDAERLEAMLKAGAVQLPYSVGGGLVAAILTTGAREAHERSDDESRGEARDRCERAMRGAMAAGLHAAEPGLPFLATVGSAAPFLGLFGTVWGIMNSFSSIAQSNDTSLAVVAPGIAEALFATALGLVAAIPAVVAYNKLATSLGRTSQRLALAITEIANRLTRRNASRAAAAGAAE